MSEQQMSLAQSYSYKDIESLDYQILKRDMVSVSPDGASTSISPGSMIQFSLSPSDALMVGRNTYFTWKVKTDASTDKIGGAVHNLINRVRVLSHDGTVFEDLNSYNVLYNGVVRNGFFSDKHELDALAVSGIYDDYSVSKAAGTFDLTTSDITACNYDHTGGAVEQLLTITGGDAVNELEVGDIIRIETAVLNHSARVLTITSASTVTVEGLPAVDIAATAILSLKVVSKQLTDYTNDGVAAAMAAGDGYEYAFTLDGSGILGNSLFVPLKYSKGLRIELYLESANIAMSVGSNYTINNPKLHTDLVMPSEAVSARLSREFNSGGLQMMFDTFSARSQAFTGTSVSLNINRPVFKAKALFAVKRLDANIAASKDSFAFPSAFTNYQAEYNHLFFPTSKVESLQRAYMETRKSTYHFGNIEKDVLSYKDFQNNKFLIAFNLLTLPEEDGLSGISLRNGRDIHLNLEVPAHAGTTLSTFLWYSNIISFKPSGLLVKN